MIAEAWDIESYLLGKAFPGHQLASMEREVPDDLRDFVRRVPGRVGALMQRLYGSDEPVSRRCGTTHTGPFERQLITAHDGFSLYDLVSYN